jgi:hypothetical protein
MIRINKALLTFGVLALALGVGARQANAGGVYTFTGSSGSLSAEVTFDNSTAGTLLVTLKNTASAQVTTSANALYAVFFNLTNNTTLGAVSANVASGSSIIGTGDSGSGTDVGGEFGFLQGISGFGGATFGISAAGYAAPVSFGPGSIFPGGVDRNGDDGGQVRPDGPDYGIVGTGGVASGTNDPGDRNPYIKNAAVFQFTIPNDLSSASQITDIRFQYGTSTSDTSFPPVPEPVYYQLATLLGLGGLGILRVRRSHRKA